MHNMNFCRRRGGNDEGVDSLCVNGPSGYRVGKKLQEYGLEMVIAQAKNDSVIMSHSDLSICGGLISLMMENEARIHGTPGSANTIC